MKTLKTLTTIMLSTTLLCGCLSTSNKDAIFTINNEPVTQAQYQKEFDLIAKNPMLSNMGVDLKNNPLDASLPFIYGGQVTPANVKKYMAESDIDGIFFVGSALKVDTFYGVINYDK